MESEQSGAHAAVLTPPGNAGDDPASRQRWERRIDVVIVMLLAVASLLAAWAGHQASLWNHKGTDFVSTAEAKQVEATRATTIRYQVMQIDLALFLGWLEADRANNTALASFYEERFPPQLQPAFAAWRASNPFTNAAAPTDPFRLPEYRVPQLEQAVTLDAEAATAFADGDRAGVVGEAHVVSTILLAMVLFFGGVSAKIAWRPAQLALLTIAGLLLLYSVVELGALPDGSSWGLTPFWG